MTATASNSVNVKLDDKDIELPIVVGTENEHGLDISKLRAQTGYITLDDGYGNTGSCKSAITFIDGEKGVLEYVGIDIDSLARNSTFEEVVFLLWNDRLPSEQELKDFEAELRAEYALSAYMLDSVKNIPADASPMHVVRSMVSNLALEDPDCNDQSWTAERTKAIRVLAKTPAIIAAFDRMQRAMFAVTLPKFTAGRGMWTCFPT